MTMPSSHGPPLEYSPYFRLQHSITSTYLEQLENQVNAAYEVLEERMSEYAQAGSGWILERNNALILEMVNYQPFGGSSYIPLPVEIANRQAVINVKNDDNECFKWAVLSALHPASKDLQRVSHYQQNQEQLNFQGIDFPMKIPDIKKFEKQNPGISVTVTSISEAVEKKVEEEEKDEEKNERKKKKKAEKKEVEKRSTLIPLRVPDKELTNNITLLYWTEEGEHGHFAWVKSSLAKGSILILTWTACRK